MVCDFNTDEDGQEDEDDVIPPPKYDLVKLFDELNIEQSKL